MTKRARRYSPEFKHEAVHLALNSPSVSSATKDLGIPEATLHIWVQKAKRISEVIEPGTEQPINMSKMIEENQRLKKCLARLEQEKAILKN